MGRGWDTEFVQLCDGRWGSAEAREHRSRPHAGWATRRYYNLGATIALPATEEPRLRRLLAKTKAPTWQCFVLSLLLTGDDRIEVTEGAEVFLADGGSAITAYDSAVVLHRA